MVHDFTGKETEDKITVDADHYYTLAEHSLEFCKFTHMVSDINKMTNAKKIKEYLKENFKYQDCKDPETCGLRKVLLALSCTAFNRRREMSILARVAKNKCDCSTCLLHKSMLCPPPSECYSLDSKPRWTPIISKGAIVGYKQRQNARFFYRFR